MTASFIFFTGSACALLLLAAAKLAISYRHQPAGRWLLVLIIGVFFYLLRPVLPDRGPLMDVLVDLPTELIPGAFWLFAFALCSECERFPRWGWALIAMSLAVGLAAAHLDAGHWPALRHWLYLLKQPLQLGLLGAGLVALLRQYQSDLVESRRNLRAVLLITIGCYMLVVVCAEFLFSYQPIPAGVPTLHAVLASGLALAACLWLLALSPGALSESLPQAAESEIEEELPEKESQPLDEQQRQLLEKLQSHMRNGGYRHTGLTIRELAEQLGTQEYMLRALINRHLGHRNFNEYLNRFRIDEASRRLADPKQAHLPVLTIALDIGYRSLSPFNAAFKRRHNQTPTEYRRQQLPI
ncbi:helix-turn-helix transcriptional regulator [Microbulbifer rhizosphaerae]|uniref:AraC-like DNA-binding protein n=1 Tax=Microbulbifer rhizosphaerae TaxID=1562603 RepID=A0A7W4ZBY3_9GAMM|nr:helix-turn-helix transcriptional regulator [Microbulbifer rhizosphaerae]MBB3062770.1 AraC-like DNA-binding protein [Microbulbifer rhizosphaerae]